MKKSAAEQPTAAPAAPVSKIPYPVGSEVRCKHPGFTSPYKGRIVRPCSTEWFSVDTADGIRIHTHYSYVLNHTPDLIGDLDKRDADRNARDQSADDSSEYEPHIIAQGYVALLRAWGEQYHNGCHE